MWCGKTRLYGTCQDEHDSRGQGYLGPGGILHAPHFDALEGEEAYQNTDDPHHNPHDHQGSHGLERT